MLYSYTSLYFQALNAAIVLGFKIESSTVKDILRMVTKIDVTTHLVPAPYEILMTTSAEIPRVNILRNKVIWCSIFQLNLNGVEFSVFLFLLIPMQNRVLRRKQSSF